MRKSYTNIVDATRTRVLQPVSDWATVHAGSNCFLIASRLMMLTVAMTLAVFGHAWVTGRLETLIVVVESPILVLVAACCAHLDRYGRERRSTSAIAKVHPAFRRFVYGSAGFVAAWVVTFPSTVLILLGDMSWAERTWHLADGMSMLPFGVGLLFAACEWRNLPRAERRAAMGVALPHGA